MIRCSPHGQGKKEHTEQEAFANKMIEEALYCTKYRQTI
jgi:hypothetical protein